MRVAKKSGKQTRRRRKNPREILRCAQDDDQKNLAHAGYYYCYVVGLFGGASPLFSGGNQVFGDRLGMEAALAEDFFSQARDAEFFAVDIFWFG